MCNNQVEQQEIEFRGKDSITDKWVFGYYAKVGPWHYIISGKMDFSTGNFIERSCVYPNSVGQYTGLKDKHGVKIYKGDVLYSKSEMVKLSDGQKTGEFSETWVEVVWEEDGWGYKVLKSNSSLVGSVNQGLIIKAKHSEIVWNVFDNLELLEEEQPKPIHVTFTECKTVFKRIGL